MHAAYPYGDRERNAAFLYWGKARRMKLNKKLIAVPALALTAGISLAACGSVKAPVGAVTHTVTAPAAPVATTPAAAAPAPKVVIVKPAPAETVYVAPAARAAPALTNCGGGVHAGADTSCPFALNVEAAWTVSGATNYITANSPVTGLNYTMYCTGSDPTTCTGGNNALVEFYF